MGIVKSQSHWTLFLLILVAYAQKNHGALKRSIDMSASYALATDDRLTRDVIPLSYKLHLDINYKELTFRGLIKMNLAWKADSNKVLFHAHFDLHINDRKITLQKINKNISNMNSTEYVPILRGSRIPRKTIYVVYLKEIVKQGAECVLEIPFDGNIWNSAEGLFTGSFNNITYFVTNLRLNNARRLFPCFDEPGFKVPFTVSITRPKDFVAIFNTPLNQTNEHPTLKYQLIDSFEETPPMSTFTFGFVISNLRKLDNNFNDKETTGLTMLSHTDINIWTLKDRQNHLTVTYEKIFTIYERIQDYFGVAIPLSKIDVVVIPDLSIVRPVDNWGLLLFKENDLTIKGYYDLTQELIYQWLGSWVTPEWWIDAHLNKALVSFLATEIVIKIDGGVEFNGKYPMTSLYSLYYEFSKRYPHSRITGMKQETISHKTELILRMLSFTLSQKSFQNGIKNFVSDHQYKTFVANNLWQSLNVQAIKDGTLRSSYNVADIVNTWLAHHRLPVVKVSRDYTKNTAILQQQVYLRERPHDVPGKDKMIWWIPIILNREDNLNFSNCSPYVWMEATQELNIENMPEKDEFIIINHEEIAPFPVNYDDKNWKMLSNFLQTDIGRKTVPIYTRAKLLHDAWNLAYAGDLSFSIAFNMTLFMKFERSHIVWGPVFTFIDQIGRHIDKSEVHSKFEAYVLFLLTPLHDELGFELETEDNWITDLRSLTKRFLCHAGYKPCIDEAQQVFKVWQSTINSSYESLVPNHYMCTVFKWGSFEEWQFGLKRVMQFPKSGKQSERTHLIKAIAGCPTQSEKINYLLETSILDHHSNFTENDQFLILTSLTTIPNGYYSLLNFLSENWTAIREKFRNRNSLWDHLIGSATGFFLTQKGYDKVHQLYEEHSGEFDSAQHIIEKSLRNIKEETKWSEENLPVIETWLDNFLANN